MFDAVLNFICKSNNCQICTAVTFEYMTQTFAKVCFKHILFFRERVCYQQ